MGAALGDQYKIVIDQLDGHAQLLMSFALAICAGIMAGSLQVMFHNRGKDRPVELRFIPLLVAAYGIAILSLGAGYALKSSLVGAVGAMSIIDFKTPTSVTRLLDQNGLGMFAFFSGSQFILLCISLILLVVVLIGNLHFLKASHATAEKKR
jgi:hypothetical protein